MARRRRRARRHVPDGPFEAHVDDLASDARGIARVDGKVTFISDALPGEDVRFMRQRKRASFDEGQVEEVIQASSQRVEPGCAHFGVCGGCSLQHLASGAQLEFKQAQMLENLRRIGRVEPEEVAPPLTGPLWGYRRRARLAVKHVPAKGRVLVGFRERGNPYVAVLESCEVLHPSVGGRLMALSELIGDLSIRERLPQIEVAVGDNAVALVLRVLDAPDAKDLDRLRSFAAEHDIHFYLQPGGLDSVYPVEDGAPDLYYQLPVNHIKIYFQPTDFMQINRDLNASMVTQALDWLEPGESDDVLELFCGLGNFSLPLATRSRQVVGVEGDAALVSRARDNAARNGINNLEFHSADLFAESQNGAWSGKDYRLALVDPPRAGAEQSLEMLASSGIERLLYVSCHPATLARDLGALVREHGFRLQRAGVMDMFPHTSHVESMALLIRN